MPAIKVDIDHLAARVRADAQRDVEACTHAVRRTVHMMAPRFLQEEIARAQPRQPVDTGDYKRQWHIEDVEHGVMVYNSSPQASVIEDGRRPGKGVSKEGQAALARWAIRKGLTGDPREARSIAFLIARKMKALGWPAKPNQPMKILAKAGKRLTVEVLAAVRRALQGEST